MQLPDYLRAAVDTALIGMVHAEPRRISRELSEHYRAQSKDIGLDRKARSLAYLATRLPATYATMRAVLAETARMRDDFAPASLLDAGAGPGTALWAARETWPDLAEAVLIERSGPIRELGERFSAALGLRSL